MHPAKGLSILLWLMRRRVNNSPAFRNGTFQCFHCTVFVLRSFRKLVRIINTGKQNQFHEFKQRQFFFIIIAGISNTNSGENTNTKIFFCYFFHFHFTNWFLWFISIRKLCGGGANKLKIFINYYLHHHHHHIIINLNFIYSVYRTYGTSTSSPSSSLQQTSNTSAVT